VRIIAGSSKGMNLLSPGEKTRPTSDRAREGLFSSLESSFGTLEGLNFLDLFSGSGAVGVEALSRGANLVHSVEKDDDASEVAAKNFNLIKNAGGKHHLFRMSAITFVQSSRGLAYDIIFMDPPYEISNHTIEEILQSILAHKLLTPIGMVAIERRSKGDPFTWPEPLTSEKVRSYGQGSIFYGGYSASVLP
jgi:16S rRNA (guanine966-N2)-methyltransferase